SLLEPVDALIVPPELEAALRRSKPAREAYEALGQSNSRVGGRRVAGGRLALAYRQTDNNRPARFRFPTYTEQR
ncbi:MAG: hypothetical protein ACR2OI_08000, partial [Acidimicrobiia bacterium]